MVADKDIGLVLDNILQAIDIELNSTGPKDGFRPRDHGVKMHDFCLFVQQRQEYTIECKNSSE